MIFAEQVKKQLLSLIGEMATVPWLFSKNPSTDFSRIRKLDFASTIQLILSMESGSIKKELLDFFKFSSDDTYFQSIPTDKGFNQFHLTQMIDRYSGGKKTIFIADRGYETYNIFAHVQEKDMYYLIRVKDGGGGKMT